MMIEEQDRTAMLSTMYQDEDEVAPTDPTVTTPLNIRSRKIRVGIVEYEVPSVEYVQQLEQTLVRQSRAIEQNRIVIDRLVATLSRARHSQKTFETEMADLRRELAKKITARDFS